MMMSVKEMLFDPKHISMLLAMFIITEATKVIDNLIVLAERKYVHCSLLDPSYLPTLLGISASKLGIFILWFRAFKLCFASILMKMPAYTVELLFICTSKDTIDLIGFWFSVSGPLFGPLFFLPCPPSWCFCGSCPSLNLHF